MGKPGPKQIPVTARIQKGTKGGIVQPSISGMGSIAKMKMHSPAKIDPDPNIKKQSDFKNEMSRQDKVKADNLAASKAKKAAKDKSNYQKNIDQYRKDVSTLNANTKAASKNVNPRQMESAMNRSVRQASRIKSFEKNLYDYDTKNKAGSTEGYTAKEYAMAKASGTYKPRNKKEEDVKVDTTTPPSNSGSGGSNTKNVKITGRIGSDLRRKQYDAKGWAYDDTIKKPKAKAVKAIKAKGVKSVAKPKAEIKTKLAATTAKPTAKPTKKQVRKTKSVERKTARAAKTRRKGIEALESGNLAKAKRLKRRETRINKRIERKKSGQASKAIEPK